MPVANSDREALQLASARTTILHPLKAGELARIGPAEVREGYGVDPTQLPDFNTLHSDPSDKLHRVHRGQDHALSVSCAICYRQGTTHVLKGPRPTRILPNGVFTMKSGYLVTALLFSAAAGSANALTPKDIAGCWRVQSVMIGSEDNKSEPLGPHPTGQLLFTNSGHMSYVVMRADLPAEWQMTNDRIVTTLIAYFGTYELQDHTLTIRAEGATRVDWRGQTLKRVVQTLSPTELVIDTVPGLVPARIVAKPC